MDGSLDNEALHNVRKLAESAKKITLSASLRTFQNYIQNKSSSVTSF